MWRPADHLADLVQRGQSAGEVGADLDPEVAAWLLFAIIARLGRSCCGNSESGPACEVSPLASYPRRLHPHSLLELECEPRAGPSRSGLLTTAQP